MKKGILKFLSAILLVSSFSSTFVACTSNQKDKPSTTESTGHRDRVSRKPQVTSDNSKLNQYIYQDGEIVSLADGSKLKYNYDGNHEILEKGSGKIIVFKKVTKEELDSLTGEERAMVERQMQADPNGFALLY